MTLNSLTACMLSAMLLAVVGCGDSSPQEEPEPPTLNFISGTVNDRNTGIPIENATVKTVPPTEVRLTDRDGRYLLKNSVFEGSVFDVLASHVGYDTGTETVTVGAAGFSGADISIGTDKNGLVASLSTLQIAQGKVTGTFLLSSTLDNTGFSFLSSNPAFTVKPMQGTLVKNELIVIEVQFSPPAGESGRVTGQLVANANNGGTPVEVNLQANVPETELLDPADQFAVLVDADNNLIDNISGNSPGVLLDPGAPVSPTNPPIVDDPIVVQPTAAGTIATWDFENGQQDWGADNGIWQVGPIPANNDPQADDARLNCQQGDQCAGTVLGNNYPAGTSSRLVSPAIALSTVTDNEILTLRFWQKFYWSGGDIGYIQLSIDNGISWVTLSSHQSSNSLVWSRRDIDLTAYAGQSVRIGFLHTANVDSSINHGWLLDSISILWQNPELTGDFEVTSPGGLESGWANWGADNGIWEVGSIPIGSDDETANDPDACHEGLQCAGTVLGSNYPPGTSSRLVSPITTLSTVSGSGSLTLRFWQWFSWGGGDIGFIQLTMDNGVNWVTVGTHQTGNSSVWSRRDIDLTEYAGETVQIGFLHTANVDSSISRGWFLDNIEIVEK